MEPLNISVSKLESFRILNDENLSELYKKTQSDFIDELRGIKVDTFEKGYGTALHSFMEHPQKYVDIEKFNALAHPGVTIDNFNIVPSVLNLGLGVYKRLERPFVNEVNVEKVIEVNRIPVRLRGRIDVLGPGIIHDYKTTKYPPKYTEYVEKVQHKIYMYLTGCIGHVYDIFTINETVRSGTKVTYDKFEFWWHDIYEQEIMSLLKNFLQFIEIHGLMENWNQMVSSSRGVNYDYYTRSDGTQIKVVEMATPYLENCINAISTGKKKIDNPAKWLEVLNNELTARH